MSQESGCSWAQSDPIMMTYHDQEWGVPSHDDTYLFEMLNLEGAQAGLSWITILKKREGYRKAFRHFDIDQCAALSDAELDEILSTGEIIRNRLKVKAVRSNAISVQKIQEDFGSFSNYMWQFTDFKPIINHWTSVTQMPAQDALSEKISKDLKKRGFKFVGPVIIYSYLQAIGMIDDHVITCPSHTENKRP
ncbi:DNA-3-methyladenine glycosylase I [Pullulanibacillus camelliae]|uniref:DNA-3-methyladenine glycosylase I n=1 Tax=Pullulanibacillus camelliae TaxID=1707096 RepID=A0A8J2VG63_9BACL|nr:DNA-3-methyladenine glycosylase I [Pullulanibacillus camelliae]GGE30089.1 DNA-3-methyladenine glycosylase I [Pullulanibacillus camelliae]